HGEATAPGSTSCAVWWDCASAWNQDRLQWCLPARHRDDGTTGQGRCKVGPSLQAAFAEAGHSALAVGKDRVVDAGADNQCEPRLAVGEGRGPSGGRLRRNVSCRPRTPEPAQGCARQTAGSGRTLVGTPLLRLLG